jgi:hypothetical protein
MLLKKIVKLSECGNWILALTRLKILSVTNPRAMNLTDII